ncbi:nuclease-related domain-containing protein [Mariprofundus erugo]|uniref:nuclease-related domain-containing protein n=1 Tax=Mariprofundus erugo TaxID=2528639 RepID=UPI001386F83F|nr:nuclease-related domain-containing protein [Mariprofundus erugo]
MVAMFTPIVAGVFALKLYLRFERKRPVRRPFTQPFMRLPGQSLRDQVEVKADEFNSNVLMMMFMPLMIFTVHVTQSYFAESPESLSRISISVIGAVGVVVYFLRKIVRNRRELNVLRLGLDGEIASAQSFESLKRKGFYVYHDFQAKGFNIDHILVGPNGVFAVETKARSKPDRGTNVADSKVTFDGQQLIFPNYTESDSIEQAKRQAQWLSKWLSSAVGESVPVSPLLVVPGWFVDLKTRPVGINITNGTNVEFIARMNCGALLSEKQIKQITHQLEQKCIDDSKEAK